MRLTEEFKGTYWDKMDLNYNQSNTSQIIDKLGQVEDIEEKHNIKSFDDLDKRLTALEIIKEKRVDTYYFMNCKTLEEYNDDVLASYGYEESDAEERMLTQEEYDLLKEVLL